MTADKNYPILMGYIAERSMREKTAWEQLRKDEAAALTGEFGELASELERAIADFAASQAAKGESTYPYNSSMGLFLGLPLRDNHEPPVGYYFARQVTHHFHLGSAQREVHSLLAKGATLKIVAARNRTTGEPIRFTTFLPHQIQIEGNALVCQNNKKRIRLSSNWSIETALQAAAAALRRGEYYGYVPPLESAAFQEDPKESCSVAKERLLFS
jgi:hypothetical protein